jgi:hypothetical protein
MNSKLLEENGYLIKVLADCVTLRNHLATLLNARHIVKKTEVSQLSNLVAKLDSLIITESLTSLQETVTQVEAAVVPVSEPVTLDTASKVNVEPEAKVRTLKKSKTK